MSPVRSPQLVVLGFGCPWELLQQAMKGERTMGPKIRDELWRPGTSQGALPQVTQGRLKGQLGWGRARASGAYSRAWGSLKGWKAEA